MLHQRQQQLLHQQQLDLQLAINSDTQEQQHWLPTCPFSQSNGAAAHSSHALLPAVQEGSKWQWLHGRNGRVIPASKHMGFSCCCNTHRARAEAREKAAAHLAAGNIAAAVECYQRCVDITPAMAKQVIEVRLLRSLLATRSWHACGTTL